MLENLKQKLQERIERNAVKIPNISWVDKEGKIHTEDIVIKRSRFPLFGDWSRIHPPVNEDGSWNFINLIFGGKKNFIILLIILSIVTMILISFKDIFVQYGALKKLCEPFFNLNPIN